MNLQIISVSSLFTILYLSACMAPWISEQQEKSEERSVHPVSRESRYGREQIAWTLLGQQPRPSTTFPRSKTTNEGLLPPSKGESTEDLLNSTQLITLIDRQLGFGKPGSEANNNMSSPSGDGNNEGDPPSPRPRQHPHHRRSPRQRGRPKRREAHPRQQRRKEGRERGWRREIWTKKL